uniref:Rapid alkalinization factor-like n=1 Tax=Davidia involucrata TaxID=16924 RepID=A0A5B7ASX4_DAVIN
MAKSTEYLVICAILVVGSHMMLSSSAVDAAAAAASGDHQLGWIPTSTCRGSIAECLAGNEFEMDSEINRRILATRRYISYGALSRNSVPCSRRGASYYNCRPGAQANPYSRGCSTITRCRR